MLSVIETKNLRKLSDFNSFDFHLIKHLQKLEGQEENSYLQWAILLLSQETSRGNVCIHLNAFADSFFSSYVSFEEEIKFPPIDEWVQQLKNSNIVGTPGEKQPLILEENSEGAWLFFYRYWSYEIEFVRAIQKKIKNIDSLDSDRINASLAKLFLLEEDTTSKDQIDSLQRAFQKKLTIITGGPGTGKTTTVVRLLALLIELNANHEFRYKLVAPTGKAASRLSESIQKGKEMLLEQHLISKETYDLISPESSTIHRLLGTRIYKSEFYYNRKNQLPLDCLIVDEASMVDLALMSKMVTAIPDHTRLILIGDKDQLVSIESGAILNDLCGDPKFLPKSLLDSIVSLTKVYRTEGEEILALSRHVNSQDLEQVKNLLSKKAHYYHRGSWNGKDNYGG